MYGAMLRGSGILANNDECNSRSAMSKLGDIGDQFPEAYCISKYNGMGTESNWNRKWKHIR